MLETIITALLPIVVTLMLGYFAGWERSFSQDQATVLNRMVMLYALPLMLFAGILSTSLSAITQNIPLFVWTAVGMVGGLILVFVLSRFVFRSSAQLAALRAIAIAGPAVPFVGTPVLGVLYPNGADIAIATGSLLMNLVQVPLALIFLVGGQQDASAPRKSALAIAGASLLNAIRQPVVWAPVLAFILLLSGLELPRSLKGSFTLLGQSTGGVALFAVGIVLFSQKVSVSLPVIVNVISKNLLLPGIILALMLVFGVPVTERGLVSVTLAIPTASIAVIFAVEYKCGTQEMASTLFWSTLLSILTMGMFIWFTA
ncbi:permease [Bordetella trematum]|uniref:Transporter n=1 Tax=Bordetella trematum TaxID=123899 RepID=A0A157PM65_9BORD|nr:AEC family transporter [Bordetella trematum]AUL48448.1 permease [Bordetella trematum]AZR95407.1 permease [Bordetella trematum]NNH17819.1 permease [Bordetella trematum]QIM70367.1 permease [Bordetella trematum]SAI34732.1 transporter [Bordetella trematum]